MGTCVGEKKAIAGRKTRSARRKKRAEGEAVRQVEGGIAARDAERQPRQSFDRPPRGSSADSARLKRKLAKALVKGEAGVQGEATDSPFTAPNPGARSPRSEDPKRLASARGTGGVERAAPAAPAEAAASTATPRVRGAAAAAKMAIRAAAAAELAKHAAKQAPQARAGGTSGGIKGNGTCVDHEDAATCGALFRFCSGERAKLHGRDKGRFRHNVRRRCPKTCNACPTKAPAKPKSVCCHAACCRMHAGWRMYAACCIVHVCCMLHDARILHVVCVVHVTCMLHATCVLQTASMLHAARMLHAACHTAMLHVVGAQTQGTQGWRNKWRHQGQRDMR